MVGMHDGTTLEMTRMNQSSVPNPSLQAHPYFQTGGPSFSIFI